MSEIIEKSKFIVIGNNLSLDFVNTKIAIHNEPKDLLEDFADLIDWALAVNLLDRNRAESLGQTLAEKSRQILREAINFRSDLHELFTEIIQKKEISKSAIEFINQTLARQNGYAEITATENGFEKRFHADFREPRQILVPIAESVADLLCYGNLEYLRKCEGENCVLYFYDTTKNHKRRWCSMSGCGNRAKVAAFYQRKKAKIA